MPVQVSVDTRLLREAAKRVKEIDPQIRKDLISGLKKDLKPYAQAIANDVPTLGYPGAMRGFNHAGRTRWSKVKASVSVTPGGGRSSVARIELYGSGDARAAFKMADLAGTRNDYRTIHGFDMVRRLDDFGKLSANGRGGRFAWAGFMKYRPRFLDITVERLDDYSAKVGVRLFG